MGQQITCASKIDVLLVSNDVSITNTSSKTVGRFAVPVLGQRLLLVATFPKDCPAKMY